MSALLVFAVNDTTNSCEVFCIFREPSFQSIMFVYILEIVPVSCFTDYRICWILKYSSVVGDI